MSVTVPTALPMAVNQSGEVSGADNCKIVNNSFGAVRVKSVTITAGDDWSLTAFGDKSTLADEKVDANKVGFAMSIGGGTQVATDDSDANSQTLISAPIDGCYMSGAAAGHSYSHSGDGYDSCDDCGHQIVCVCGGDGGDSDGDDGGDIEDTICYHDSTSTGWNGCEWYERCNYCDELLDSGTSHGASLLYAV